MRISGPVSYYGFQDVNGALIHIFGDKHGQDTVQCIKCKKPECQDITVYLKKIIGKHPSSARFLLEAGGRHDMTSNAKNSVMARVKKAARKWPNVLYVDIRRMPQFEIIEFVLNSLLQYAYGHVKVLDREVVALMKAYCPTVKALWTLLDRCISKRGTVLSDALAKLTPAERAAVLHHFDKTRQSIPKLALYEDSFRKLMEAPCQTAADNCTLVILRASILFMDVYAISCLLLATRTHGTILLYVGNLHASNCSKFLATYLHQQPVAWPCRYNKDGDGIQCIHIPDKFSHAVA